MRSFRYVWIIWFCFFLGGCIGASQIVLADELHFTAKAILPENQMDKEKTHFDLRMKPDQQQTIQLEVHNISDHPIKLLVHLSNAVTNSNGVIDYPNQTVKSLQDDSLRLPFTSIASSEKEIDLQSQETKQISIQLRMPKEPFDGIILGAVRIEEAEVEQETNKRIDNKGMGIRNRFDYLVGVRLSETDQEIKPTLSLLSVKASQLNYRNVVKAKIQNPYPIIINHLKINAKVYQKRSNTVLYEETKEEKRMAPNSFYEVPISLKTKPFEAGIYLLKLNVTDGQQTWKFQKEFEITRKEAEKYNKKSAVELDHQINWRLYLGIGLLIILLLVAIIIWLTIQNKRKNSRKKKKKQKEKKKSAVSKKSHSFKSKHRK